MGAFLENACLPYVCTVLHEKIMCVDDVTATINHGNCEYPSKLMSWGGLYITGRREC